MTSIKKSSHNNLGNLKVAIVYDWFDSWGGAERLLVKFAKIFPQADWYSSISQNASFGNHPVHRTFLQHIPFIRSRRSLSVPFYPMAFETLNFSGYDLVISITSSFAKGIITKPETPHVCYMLTPTRFLWVLPDEYMSRIAQKLLKPYLNYIKKWDHIAAKRPDKILAISQTVAKRIQDVYQLHADVMYPPFDIDYWEKTLRIAAYNKSQLPDSYYLVASRLKKYKKVDLVIRTFNRLPKKHLVIVGKGPEEEYLRSISHRNIHFLGNVSDPELAYVYGHAKGFIMPQEEDFGYTSLEAQLCSCPVIAYNKGGATETVKHLKTGYLFPEQTPESLIEALEKFEEVSYTIDQYIQLHGSDVVRQFDESAFTTAFLKSIHTIL